MKPITTTALALVAAASATPAAAQYGMAPAPSNSQSISAAPKEEPAKAQKLNPSKKALPALLELQTAVNKNDFASVPAKVAAAQAVATTKEDRYMIGNFSSRRRWRRRIMRRPARRSMRSPVPATSMPAKPTHFT